MRILGSLIIVFLTVFASSLEVYLEKNPVSVGEEARLVIKASGNDIELPDIQTLGGFDVVSKSLGESVISQNGDFVVNKVLSLTFYPDKNTTIEPISVKIDGKEYKSEPIELVVKKSKSQESYVEFGLKADKKEAYVGEPVILDMELKIKRGLNIINYDFIPPKFEGFWVKELKSTNKYLEEHGDYLIKRVKFLLLPQKSGLLKISPAIFKYAISQSSTDLFGFSVSAPIWRSVVSNEVAIVAKPLPKDVDLVGDFNLSVKADKNVTKINEPVNITVELRGSGSLESFDGIDLDVKGATVYEDKPKMQERLIDGRLVSLYTQKFSIISDRNFTVSPVRVEYFSLKEKSLKELKSPPLEVEVVGASPIKPPKADEVKKIVNVTEQKDVGGFDIKSFVFGFLAGSLAAMVVFSILLFKKKKSFGFSFRGKKDLLNRLLPYLSGSKEARSMAEALYEEIYEGKKSRIRKKDVEELVRKLND